MYSKRKNWTSILFLSFIDKKGQAVIITKIAVEPARIIFTTVVIIEVIIVGCSEDMKVIHYKQLIYRYKLSELPITSPSIQHPPTTLELSTEP
jgi:hypothetical protein